MELALAALRVAGDLGLLVRVFSAPLCDGAPAKPQPVLWVPPTFAPPAIEKEHDAVEQEAVCCDSPGFVPLQDLQDLPSLAYANRTINMNQKA